MRILYIGGNWGTSGHRMAALSRLGHEVTLLNPYALIPLNRAVGQWKRHTGGFGLIQYLRWRIRQKLGQPLGRAAFDVAWVDHGEMISAGLVDDLKTRIPRVICYTVDDPFGSRDRMLWREFLKAVPRYDLLVVVRPPNVEEAYRHGAKKVLRVFMSADEVAHAPRQLSAAEYEQWKSEVVFVGTAFPERGPFLADLVRRGVPLTIYGNRYQRLPEWPILQPCWRNVDTDPADAYACAIGAAKICLGLLSKGNRDLHTTRSMEIPSFGSLLCAERTSEHLQLYQEDREAVFWSSPEECAAKCQTLLADDFRRSSIAAAGHRRYLKNPWRNEQVVQDILNATVDLEGSSLPMRPAGSLTAGGSESAAGEGSASF